MRNKRSATLRKALGEKQEALEAQHAQVASNEEENKNETAATLESEKDAKAEELAPWAQQTAETKVAVDTARAELALVAERATKARRQLQKNEAALANLCIKCKAHFAVAQLDYALSPWAKAKLKAQTLYITQTCLSNPQVFICHKMYILPAHLDQIL